MPRERALRERAPREWSGRVVLVEGEPAPRGRRPSSSESSRGREWWCRRWSALAGEVEVARWCSLRGLRERRPSRRCRRREEREGPHHHREE